MTVGKNVFGQGDKIGRNFAIISNCLLGIFLKLVLAYMFVV
jgi:tetrahydromethanopterin S-methyltransferase subunit G